MVAFESGRRLGATLAAVAERWPARRLAVCRELSKLHEQVLRGTAAEVIIALGDETRGEVVLVLEPVGAGPGGGPAAGGTGIATTTRITEILQELLQKGLSVKDVAGVVNGLTGMPGRAAYELALEAKRRSTDQGQR